MNIPTSYQELIEHHKVGQSFIYLMGNVQHGWFKIGKSDDPVRRMNDLTVPFALELLRVVPVPQDVVFSVERLVQEKYQHLHLNKEWFKDIDPERFVTVVNAVVASDFVQWCLQQAAERQAQYEAKDQQRERRREKYKEHTVQYNSSCQIPTELPTEALL